MVVRGRARSCAVVRGRARSCAVVRAWSVIRGRAWSCVVGRAWSCAVGRARSCGSARFAASTAVTRTKEGRNERTSNNPLNPPGVGWVNFFYRIKVRVSKLIARGRGQWLAFGIVLEKRIEYGRIRHFNN